MRKLAAGRGHLFRGGHYRWRALNRGLIWSELNSDCCAEKDPEQDKGETGRPVRGTEPGARCGRAGVEGVELIGLGRATGDTEGQRPGVSSLRMGPECSLWVGELP